MIETQERPITTDNMNLDGANYINGEFRESAADVYANMNPSTETVLGSYPQSSAEEVTEAYTAARQAFPEWKTVSRLERAEYMYRVAKLIEERTELLATAISLETGKNYNESIAEVNEALHMAQYAFGSGRTQTGEAVASELAEKDSYMLRKPKGVVAIVSPFNFPLAIGMFWCAAPALVEGNTVVVKPSEDAPWSTDLAMRIYHDAGLPAGVMNVVHGDGAVGNHLVNEPVDHICFTGSAEVGQHIRLVCAKSWHKTCSCEMGSKSACLIFEDADIDLALDAAVASAFKLSGQRCVSSGRLIVHESILDEFVEGFVDRATKCQPNNPFSPVIDDPTDLNSYTPNPDCYYGPLVNKSGLEKVLTNNKLVNDDPDCDVRMVGQVLEGKGHFITPQVYVTKWKDAPYLKNEVFGPHVSIIPFKTVEEAVEIYNDTEYGLAVGILTNNYKVARYCRDNCEYGMCYWNGGSIAAESHLAFGGVKKSGNGYPTAARTFRAVTHEVSWTVNHGENLAFPQGME